MASRLRVVPLALLILMAVPLAAAGPESAALEKEAAEAARAGRWPDVLAALKTIAARDPERYADGRLDFLAARALAASGSSEEALPRFLRFVTTADLLEVPARLAAGRILLASGEAKAAIDVLLPLLQRREGAVARRAVRTVLDALETRPDPKALELLVAARPPLATRERRRLTALRAEALDAAGDPEQAVALRTQLLGEARRDDAAAVVLAHELRRGAAEKLSDQVLLLLIDTARAQRDLELAEKLAVERDRRAQEKRDAVELWAARFDLGRLRASRGRFGEAEQDFRSVLKLTPRSFRVPRFKKDDGAGTAAFFARVRFNLGAVLERQGQLDAASRELEKVEKGRVGPSGLATLQRARLFLRRGELDRAEQLLSLPSVAREAGRIEGTLLLVERRAEAGESRAAARALAKIELLARRKRLPEPWRSELPFWRGRVAEAAGATTEALAEYTAQIGIAPYSAAGEIARNRILSLPEEARAHFLKRLRVEGESLLGKGRAAAAATRLLPAAALGDAQARDFLRVAYRAMPAYADVLLAPDPPDDALASLCGDAAACRLIQMGLSEEAEPIVRDARRLDTLTGCMLAARLAEDADAGPAALEAAEALARRIPADFLLELAPRGIRRALGPRPFDRQVTESAAAVDVPADLLYAIMRQESRFDREAASPAAARGLMQLTLPAAGDAARELNEQPPAYADLYDAGRSIRLGARTVKSLLGRWEGDTAAVVSSYNAGAGQTSLWLGGGRDGAESLLAAISYPETRGYFRRVLSNRLVYRLYRLGEERLGEEPVADPGRPGRR